MTVRTGMAGNIAELRARCNLGTADYTVAGVAYFADDQLQDVLDEHMVEMRELLLVPVQELNSGSYTYKNYPLPSSIGAWVEDSIPNDGVAFGRLYDLNGSNAGTANFSANWKAKRIIFNSDQAGKNYLLDVRKFNIDAATAATWRKKASLLADNVDWKSDNHDIKASQEYEHCIAMAEQWESSSGISSSGTFRRDMRPSARRPDGIY